MKQYIKEHGRPTAIIYRIKGSEETLQCPFCKNTHIHGGTEGHRIAHCAWTFTRGGNVKHEPKDSIKADDGTELLRRNGYVIVDISPQTDNQPK